jgi:hypothetical protein
LVFGAVLVDGLFPVLHGPDEVVERQILGEADQIPLRRRKRVRHSRSRRRRQLRQHTGVVVIDLPTRERIGRERHGPEPAGQPDLAGHRQLRRVAPPRQPRRRRLRTILRKSPPAIEHRRVTRYHRHQPRLLTVQTDQQLLELVVVQLGRLDTEQCRDAVT